MHIKFNFDHILPLLLIPSLFLASTFLPEWFIITSTLQLMILTFFKIPKYAGYINFYFVYLIFETVGKQIIPETMIPFLASCLLAQMHYNKSIGRDESFLFFLWLGIFSVFSSSFNYLVYTIIVLIYFFLYQSTDNSLNIKAILRTFMAQKYQLLATSIVAIALFIFFPRFYNFLPSANYKTKGEIGYSQKIDNSNTSSLSLSAKTAFYAELEPQLPIANLYWRGKVHTRTDGYNWSSGKLSPQSKPDTTIDKSNLVTAKMKYEQDFGGDVIILDTPIRVKGANLPTYSVNPTFEFKFYNKKKKASLTTFSLRSNNRIEEIKDVNFKAYTQLPKFLSKSLKEILVVIDSDEPDIIIRKFKQYILREKYSYTLNPGRIPTLASFIKAKKGYCTHFSSLLGVILRAKKVPTRLISGFQGGTYNKVGKFYEVRSNDAHAWLEYYHNNKWNRVDPTEFISPERIQFGGSQFLTQPKESLIQSKDTNSLFNLYNTVKLRLDTINYQVSLFFDNYDRNKQNDLSKLLKLNLRMFFLFGFVLICLLVSIYLYLTRVKVKKTVHPIDKHLIKLDRKIKLDQKLSDQTQISEMKKIIKSSHFTPPTIKGLLKIISEYQIVRYGRNSKQDNLIKLIKNIKLKK